MVNVKRTDRDLSKLKPDFRIKVDLWVAKVNSRIGTPLSRIKNKMFITEGRRHKLRQAYLWTIGRSIPGIKCTWTRISKHQSGRAVDIAFRGKVLYPEDMEMWKEVATIAKEFGIDRMFDLKGIDKPHFQDNRRVLKNALRPKLILTRLTRLAVQYLIDLNHANWKNSVRNDEKILLSKTNDILRSFQDFYRK